MSAPAVARRGRSFGRRRFGSDRHRHGSRPPISKSVILSSSEEENEEAEMGAREVDCSLHMKCYSMELDPAQAQYYARAEKDCAEFKQKLEAKVASLPDAVVENMGEVTLMEFISSVSGITQPIGNNQSIIVQGPSQTNNYQYVVNPRGLGVIVNQNGTKVISTTGSSPISPNNPPVLANNSMNKVTVVSRAGRPVAGAGKQNIFVPIPAGTKVRVAPETQEAVATGSPYRSPKIKLTIPPQPVAMQVAGSSGAIMNKGTPSGKASSSTVKVNSGAKAGSSGVNTASPQTVMPIVDLTEDEALSSDSREVSISKISGKTYPSLVVVARPYLNTKNYPASKVNAERNHLDAQVKQILMVSASSFTEWLLQQGLVRVEQFCINHTSPPMKLKLGMYSDTAKFPYSGGYVWISECCPQQFVSVFSGSIFEGAPHPPTVLVKLLYHWACHTNIQNVVQWVKVDNLYVKTLFTNLRAVCTAALHNKFEKMGGPNKKIQVGVISLGTTTQDGNCKQVKVEVLGILDPEEQRVRIRAIEPIHQIGGRKFRKRFMKILEPLQHWVDKESIILTDFTVDKGTLNSMGYHNVFQVSANDTSNSSFSNQPIMEYLRKIVPRMFQNTLSLLSRHIIQQFLDELVWRETYGAMPSLAFKNMIEHIAEQTRLETGGTLLNRLSKIAANPFKNWKYDRWAANCRVNSSISSDGEDVTVIRSDTPSSDSTTPTPAKVAPSTPVVDPTPHPLSQVEAVVEEGTGSLTGRGAPRRRSVHLEPAVILEEDVDDPMPQESSEAEPHFQPAMIPLEPYYYGTFYGVPSTAADKINMSFACTVCGKVQGNNVQLMDHLILHALNRLSLGDQKDICRLCCKICLSSSSLKAHFNQVHRDTKSTVGTTCHICNLRLRDKSGLIAHMSKTHFELEMPYYCSLCHFRTSLWHRMVTHFKERHTGGIYGSCPYCFKIFTFVKDGTLCDKNQYAFIQHIQRHQFNSFVRKCTRCAIYFVNKQIQEDHERSLHSSCKDIPEVEREMNEDSVLMPAPLVDPTPGLGQKGGPRYRSIHNTNNFRIANFRTLRISSIQEETYNCSECEAAMTDDHYMGHLSCTKCRFETCCQTSMSEHTVAFHVSWAPRFTIGFPTWLSDPIYCACSYSTFNGNHMAEHLKKCQKTTCYGTVPKLGEAGSEEEESVSQKEDEEKAIEGQEGQPDQVKSDEPKTILNLLGLVRKPSVEEQCVEQEQEAGAVAPEATPEIPAPACPTPAPREVPDTQAPEPPPEFSKAPQEQAMESEASKSSSEKEDKVYKMVVDPDVVEIMDFEEGDENSKMAVDSTPSPEAMVLD